MYSYKTHGTCSTEIRFDVKNNIITEAQIINGCRGNTTGLCALLKGMNVDEAIARMEGIQCRGGTSCPDQFAQALKAYRAQQG